MARGPSLSMRWSSGAALSRLLLFAGAQWDGQSVPWQDMPTNCITSASVTKDNDMPYASGRK